MDFVLPIASLAAALLLAIVTFFVSRRWAVTKGNAILLVGPSYAGKTAIFSTLVHGESLPSHASIQTNASAFSLKSDATPSSLNIIDIPGHPRIRDQFKEHLAKARAIVFVVDAGTVSRAGAAVAEHLHHILNALATLPPSVTMPPLAIPAHKSDLLHATSTTGSSHGALAISRVRNVLERELDKRKASQSGGAEIEGLGDDGEQSGELGGLECVGTGGAFRFASWEGGEIPILATSVQVGGKSEKSDSLQSLDSLTEWLLDVI